MLTDTAVLSPWSLNLMRLKLCVNLFVTGMLMAPNSVTVGGFTPIACALGVGLDHGDANGNWEHRDKEERGV